MPRLSCPKCKLSFSIKDPNRKSTECPDCGYRVLLGDQQDSPARQCPRPAPSAGGRKSGLPVPLVVGGVLVAVLLLGVVGGGVWYFKFRENKPIAKIDDPPPAVEPKIDPKPQKRLKITSTPKLEGNDIYKLLLPATVMIRTDNALGSGVLICRDPNLIVTNHHVVGELATVRIISFPEFTETGQVIRERSYYDESSANSRSAAAYSIATAPAIWRSSRSIACRKALSRCRWRKRVQMNSTTCSASAARAPT